jgi:hypothetical protein
LLGDGLIGKAGRSVFGEQKFESMVLPFIRPLTDLKWFYSIKGYKQISSVLPAFTARYMNFKHHDQARDKTPVKDKPLDEHFFTSAKVDNKDPFQRAFQSKQPESPRLILKTKNSEEAILVEIIEDQGAPNRSLGALLKRDEVNRIRHKEIPQIHIIEKKPADPEAVPPPEKLTTRVSSSPSKEGDLRFMKEYSLEHFYKTKNPKGQLPEVIIEEDKFNLSQVVDEATEEDNF